MSKFVFCCHLAAVPRYLRQTFFSGRHGEGGERGGQVRRWFRQISSEPGIVERVQDPVFVPQETALLVGMFVPVEDPKEKGQRRLVFQASCSVFMCV